MTNTKPLQEQKIARHLLAGKTLTGLQALRLFGCYRLAAVIHALRAEWGMTIGCEMIHDGRKMYGRYTSGDSFTQGIVRARWRALANGKPIPRAGRMRLCGTAK